MRVLLHEPDGPVCPSKKPVFVGSGSGLGLGLGLVLVFVCPSNEQACIVSDALSALASSSSKPFNSSDIASSQMSLSN